MRYIALLLAGLFISGAAYAQEAEMGAAEETEMSQAGDDFEWSYSEWDANDDDMLDEQEFNTGFEESGLYDEWDVNDDGYLDEDEFGDGLYDSWDEDDSGYLEEDEAEEVGFWDW